MKKLSSVFKKESSHNKKSFIRKKTKAPISVNSSSAEYDKQYNDMCEKADKRKSKKHRKLKKVLLIILCVLLAIILVACSTVVYLYYSGKSEFSNNGQRPKLPASENVTDNGNVIVYKNEKYVFDEDVNTILCIGVDKDEATQIKTDVYGTAGQADAIYLICIDNTEKKYNVLSINRDSMIDVDIYDTNGKFVGIKKAQACVSFAYGDGKEKSCQNTVKAISRMLYNVPINSYFSINKASFAPLNDIIGGVDVPVYDDDGNATGKITHLDGKEAYDYIHYRDISKLDSNITRMKRQTSYIKAFAAKAIKATKSDISKPLELFETTSLYSTTDLNASKITYLTVNAFADRNDIKLDFKSVPGKVTKGKDGYAEYEVDEEKLLEIIIDIFYDKLEEK